MKIGYLSIRTWNAYDTRRVPHWYGSISVRNAESGLGEDVFNVERELSRFEAEELNRHDDATYEKGDVSSRFFDEESMLQAACEVAKANSIDVVIDGIHYVRSPQRIVFGPEPLTSELNALWKHWEGCVFDPAADTKTLEKQYSEKIKAWK